MADKETQLGEVVSLVFKYATILYGEHFTTGGRVVPEVINGETTREGLAGTFAVLKKDRAEGFEEGAGAWAGRGKHWAPSQRQGVGVGQRAWMASGGGDRAGAAERV